MQRHPQWKSKVQEIFQTCQSEIKRTTAIGKKMLTASKTNSCLHEAYEELGMLVARAIEEGEIDWQNQRVDELLQTINSCQQDLEEIEVEVNKIKFSAGPQDISQGSSLKRDYSPKPAKSKPADASEKSNEEQ